MKREGICAMCGAKLDLAANDKLPEHRRPETNSTNAGKACDGAGNKAVLPHFAKSTWGKRINSQ